MAVYLLEQNIYRETSSFKNVATVIEITLKDYPSRFNFGNEDIAKLLFKKEKYEPTVLEGNSIIYVALSDKKYLDEIYQILNKNNIKYDLSIAYGYEEDDKDDKDNGVCVCLIKNSEVFIHGNSLHFISKNTGSLGHPIRKYDLYFPLFKVYKYSQSIYCINYNSLKNSYDKKYTYHFDNFLDEFNIKIDFISKEIYYSLEKLK